MTPVHEHVGEGKGELKVSYTSMTDAYNVDGQHEAEGCTGALTGVKSE